MLGTRSVSDFKDFSGFEYVHVYNEISLDRCQFLTQNPFAYIYMFTLYECYMIILESLSIDFDHILSALQFATCGLMLAVSLFKSLGTRNFGFLV